MRFRKFLVQSIHFILHKNVIVHIDYIFNKIQRWFSNPGNTYLIIGYSFYPNFGHLIENGRRKPDIEYKNSILFQVVSGLLKQFYQVLIRIDITDHMKQSDAGIKFFLNFKINNISNMATVTLFRCNISHFAALVNDDQGIPYLLR